MSNTDAPLGKVNLDVLAYNLLQERARKNRRTMENEASIILEEQIYWERYGTVERPANPDQPKAVRETSAAALNREAGR